MWHFTMNFLYRLCIHTITNYRVVVIDRTNAFFFVYCVNKLYRSVSCSRGAPCYSIKHISKLLAKESFYLPGNKVETPIFQTRTAPHYHLHSKKADAKLNEAVAGSKSACVASWPSLLSMQAASLIEANPAWTKSIVPRIPSRLESPVKVDNHLQMHPVMSSHDSATTSNVKNE